MVSNTILVIRAVGRHTVVFNDCGNPERMHGLFTKSFAGILGISDTVFGGNKLHDIVYAEPLIA